MKKFALAGNPNCGKTTLFNSLTGSTAYVGNWPGVTVDKKEGIYKKLDEEVSIIDLPGIYSLSPYTSEEVISRNYIINEKPDCIINIIDATNLERNLYLTTQLLEMDVPVVIALNMADEIVKNGDKIDIKKLENKIGLKVVLISALKEENLDELMKVAYNESLKPRIGKGIFVDKQLNELVEKVSKLLINKKIENPYFHAIKLIENDDLEVKDHHELVEEINNLKKDFKNDIFNDDFEAMIANARYNFICEDMKKVLKKGEHKNLSRSEKIDKVLTNRWASIPIFLLILFLIFHLTFSENFLFLGGLFENIAPCFEGTSFEGLFYTDAGINSPGVIFTNLFTSITGLLGDLVRNLLQTLNASTWVVAFICDGVLEGLFAILGFLPQIL